MEEVEGITHKTINYVDDSNSVIGGRSKSDVNKYIAQYYTLLRCFYCANGMQLNGDKTAILVVTSSKDDRDPTSITLKTEDDEIVRSQRQIKVLGWLTNGRRSMDSQLNASISKIHYCYIKYASITKFMPKNLRANLARTCILSINTYSLEFYFA